ncbi:MAG: dTMP kinase [Salinisphaeraceae bacterium]|nr:dTMP kinase [Salinisphaeraceae bacterium]
MSAEVSTDSPGNSRFITLEGVEGAGKSSQLPLIQSWLEKRGRSVITTREPGGTALAESIRSVLVDGEDMPPMSELLLMFAARCSHLEDKIRPALDEGNWVICDRFIDASYAYQGAGRGLGEDTVAKLEAMTLQGLQPDQVFIFDIPVQAGLERVATRGESNRFDVAGIDFMEKVRACYLQRAAAAPGRYTVIDASQDMQAVTAQVQHALEKLL